MAANVTNAAELVRIVRSSLVGCPIENVKRMKRFVTSLHYENAPRASGASEVSPPNLLVFDGPAPMAMTR